MWYAFVEVLSERGLGTGESWLRRENRIVVYAFSSVFIDLRLRIHGAAIGPHHGQQGSERDRV